MSDAHLPTTVRLAHRVIAWIRARPAVDAAFGRFARWYDAAMDYRRYGLLRDDLIPEEHDVVYRALERLSDREMFERTFRLRRAVQLHMNHEELPPAERVPPEKDVPYLWPHIEAIVREDHEAASFDRRK